jgi:hypothetical protein
MTKHERDCSKTEESTAHTTPEDWAFELGYRHGRRACDPADKAFDEVRCLAGDDPNFKKKFYRAFAAGMESAFAASDGGRLAIGDGTYKSFVTELATLTKIKTENRRNSSHKL